MNEKPGISVIIPTYNRAQYIREAIDSVLEQSCKDWEIIVVDDGSTDNTRDILKAYAKVRYIYQKNKGPGAARNLGVRNSRAEHIAFLDSDDLWLPEKLKKQREVLESRPELAFVCSQTCVIDDKGKLLFYWRREKDNKECFEGLREENFISTTTVLMRRECFESVGGFDEKLSNAQDYDLWLRLSKRYGFLYMDEIFCLVRKHATNNTKNTDGRVRSYQRLLKKHEIWSDMPFMRKRMRFARIYHEFASCYAASKRYREAAKYYLKAALEYPFVGNLFPGKSDGMFNNPGVRLLRPYLLSTRYFFKRGKINA
ncbi:MAG: glycosyltransferase [Candidatus Omnitrophica bacterium]|nr:glycosyltransferase [Candidatus Omnitrophota bacterium]MDD5553454.1 glycosyltransferase [Candidatus Omnitrophota bacterium]